MIEKNESKNPSYKQATEGMLVSDNFVWGEYLVDQYEIPNYDTIDYDYQGLTSAYLIGGKMFQASTEAYMTSSECNDRNYWSVSGYGQVGVSDKRNPKRIRLIRDL